MNSKQLSLLILLTAANFTTQSPLSPVTPSSTVIGIPTISITTSSVCNVEGSPELNFTAGGFLPVGTYSYVDPLQCQYVCATTTPCQFFSWNTTPSAFNNGNCQLWSPASDPLGFPGGVKPGNTSVFFSSKIGVSCYNVVHVNSTESVPFRAEEGVWVNTAVDDCGIEGTATDAWNQNMEYTFNYTSILTCQQECDTEEGCLSYSWNTNTTGDNCAFTYAWVAGSIIPGKTGVYFSDATRVTSNPCFSNAPFGTTKTTTRELDSGERKLKARF